MTYAPLVQPRLPKTTPRSKTRTHQKRFCHSSLVTCSCLRSFSTTGCISGHLSANFVLPGPFKSDDMAVPNTPNPLSHTQVHKTHVRTRLVKYFPQFPLNRKHTLQHYTLCSKCTRTNALCRGRRLIRQTQSSIQQIVHFSQWRSLFTNTLDSFILLVLFVSFSTLFPLWFSGSVHFLSSKRKTQDSTHVSRADSKTHSFWSSSS